MKYATSLRRSLGFTLVELMVVIAIIGILSAIVFASLGESRKIARDSIRQTDLKNLQVAIELYKAQNGRYPTQGCGTVHPIPTSSNSQWAGAAPAFAPWGASCTVYIQNLTPDFISVLPIDPAFQTTSGVGYYYKTNTAGTAYKVLAHMSVEKKFITAFTDDFARCPADVGSGSFCSPTPAAQTYAVYSAGAKDW